MESDIELFDRYKNGDDRAFHILYEKYRAPLYSYICHITGSKEQGEDIYAEIWTALIKNAHRYHGENFRSLLYRIAYNKSLNCLKKSNNEARAVQQLGKETLASSESSELSYEEQVLIMDELVSELSEASQQTIQLRKSGLSYEEIADKTQTPIGTVKSRMFNIIKKLRKQVQRHDVP